MNLSATSAPHSSNEAPAACGGPSGSTPQPPAGESTAVAPAPASFPASSPGAATSHSPASPSPTPASFPLASTASVPTQRAARYGKQLVTHMAHKVTGEWNESSGSGYLLFDREGPAVGRFDVSAMPSALVLELRTTPERAAHLEHVAGIHLARFGVRDALTISWRRTDGSTGTTQGPLTPADIEAHARAKKATREAAREAGQAE